MVIKALVVLRKKIKQKKRRNELIRAGKSYVQDNSYAWSGLDGEDFKNW